MNAVGRSIARFDGEPEETFVDWEIDTDPILMPIRIGGVILDTADPAMRTCLEIILTAIRGQRSALVAARPPD